jgi:hypothetical protein
MAYIEFIDRSAGETAGCIVRASAGGVALGLTFESNGGLEAYMDPDVAERLATELLTAASAARAARDEPNE